MTPPAGPENPSLAQAGPRSSFHRPIRPRQTGGRQMGCMTEGSAPRSAARNARRIGRATVGGGVMALKVVGAGFGRTGTNSIKLALEEIGYGPCHHMFEVMDHRDQLPYWQAAARGALPDWDEVFAGYVSCVDWPAARFWREIAAHFADAKVLLSVRPEDDWLKSIHRTIYPTIRDRARIEPGYGRDTIEMAHALVWEGTFGGRLGDADRAIAVYRRHNEAVKAAIAPERLLIFDPAEGWAPLCRFLGVPVPDTDFPHTNRSDGQFDQEVHTRIARS
jgi:Sulfotransferase domain